MELKHVALYAKDWYKRTDIWEDVKACLRAHDYMPETQADVISILIANMADMLTKHFPIQFLLEVISNLHPAHTYSYGYITKQSPYSIKGKDYESLPEYDYYTAVLYYLLSKLRYMNGETICGLPKPDAKVLPIAEGKAEKIKEFHWIEEKQP